MLKIIDCPHCGGSAIQTIKVCDHCGSDNHIGEYQGKDTCQACWAATLSEEDIKNL